MKADIKEGWVAKLRSGQYEQTTGALQEEGRFCCLGVLCEYAVEQGVIEPPLIDEFGAVYDGSSAVLPLSVAEWAGLDGECGNLPNFHDFPRLVHADDCPDSDTPGHDHGYYTALTDLNDEAGFDFLRIADVIEKKF